MRNTHNSFWTTGLKRASSIPLHLLCALVFWLLSYDPRQNIAWGTEVIGQSHIKGAERERERDAHLWSSCSSIRGFGYTDTSWHFYGIKTNKSDVFTNSRKWRVNRDELNLPMSLGFLLLVVRRNGLLFYSLLHGTAAPGDSERCRERLRSACVWACGLSGDFHRLLFIQQHW